MADALKDLPVAEKAAWYRRLADFVGHQLIEGRETLASRTLRWWLDNRSPLTTIYFEAPDYLRTHPKVLETLAFHRRVFLTQEQARGTRRAPFWAGVIPRLQRQPGFQVWDLRMPLELTYESLVDVAPTPAHVGWIQQFGTPVEKDLLASLRGFQLRSRVGLIGVPAGSSGNLLIKFNYYYCEARDRYDWDYSEQFTVPNPDYGSMLPNAVRPQEREVTVYHRNAKDVEDHGLAAPYDLVSYEWLARDPLLTYPETINWTRSL